VTDWSWRGVGTAPIAAPCVATSSMVTEGGGSPCLPKAIFFFPNPLSAVAQAPGDQSLRSCFRWACEVPEFANPVASQRSRNGNPKTQFGT
jgi:hypothetical protein